MTAELGMRFRQSHRYLLTEVNPRWSNINHEYSSTSMTGKETQPKRDHYDTTERLSFVLIKHAKLLLPVIWHAQTIG